MTERWCALSYVLFFFNDTATTEIYTLSLHDALPIYVGDPKCRPTWSIYLLTSKAGCFSKIVMVPIGQMLVDQKGHQMKMIAYMVNVKLTKKAK